MRPFTCFVRVAWSVHGAPCFSISIRAELVVVRMAATLRSSAKSCCCYDVDDVVAMLSHTCKTLEFPNFHGDSHHHLHTRGASVYTILHKLHSLGSVDTGTQKQKKNKRRKNTAVGIQFTAPSSTHKVNRQQRWRRRWWCFRWWFQMPSSRQQAAYIQVNRLHEITIHTGAGPHALEIDVHRTYLDWCLHLL